MRVKPKALIGQIVADVMLVSLLAVVTTLIGVRSVVRGARAVGLLPPKELTEIC